MCWRILQGRSGYFLIIGKNHFKFFGSAQDHKRLKEGDKGPNTGGMGAYSPAPVINRTIEKKIIEKLLILLYLPKRKKYYTVFYVGLMIKNMNRFS